MTCNPCQEQLLHFVYDVLDDAEKAEIARHLEECPMCQAALNGLRGQQELLAEAAKESFNQVSFQPPADTPKRLGEPTLAMPRRQRGFSWVRVALAASIVVFVFGGGTMGVLGWFRTKSEIEVAEARVQKAKAEEEEYQQSLQKQQKQTKEEIRAIQEQIDRLFKEWSRDAVKVHKENAAKPKIVLSGPRNNPAGAQPTWNFDVANTALPQPAAPPAGAGAPKKMAVLPNFQNDSARANVQVIDKANNETIFQQQFENVQERGNNFKMPPLAIPPGANNLAVRLDVYGKDGKIQAQEEVSLSSLEYLTHLITDRPMYRPREVVYFRSLTLERFSLKPAQEDLHLVYRILGPNQQEIFKLEGAATVVNDQNKMPIQGPDGKPLRGLGAGAFQLPADAPGGQYTVTVSEGQNRFPTEKRSFLVNQWQMPRMNKELKFHRSSYGPGDLVEVHTSAKRGEGGAPLAGQPAKVLAVVDDNIVHAANLVTKADGTLDPIRFSLPAAKLMKNGRGLISIEFHDGAGPETIAKPIPIVLNKLYVEFFPEGGDLIQGVPNRVYFQAKNTIGKPAELKGRIVDQTGAVAATVETLHDDLEEGINQGQGSFTFTPAVGKKYELKIDTPIGIQGKHSLPESKPVGVVLHLTKPVADESIDVEVTSADTQRLLMVGAYCRGRLLDQRHIGAPAGKTQSVTLKTEPGVSGVYRITVYEIVVKGDDMQFIPLAERLTYRKGAERVSVALNGVKEAQTPGEHVTLKLKAQDEKNRKTPVVALVSVVDLSLIKLADDKTERGMPTHFLLTTEIRQPEDFENADVLLGKHAKAETALDHLLGTQGWRRFAEQDPLRFQQQHNRDAPRILALLAATNQRPVAAGDVVAEKVDKVYAAKAVQLQEQLANKEVVENGPLDAAQHQNALEASAVAAIGRLEKARERLHDYETRMVQYLLGALVIGMLIFGLGAIALGVRRLGQGRSALAALVTGTALLLFLFMGSLAGVFYMIGSKDDPMQALNQRMDREVAKAAMPAPKVDAAPPGFAAGAAPAPPMPPAPEGMGLEKFGGAPDGAADQKNDRVELQAKMAPDFNRFAMEPKAIANVRAPAPLPRQNGMPAGGAMPMQGGFAGQMMQGGPGGQPQAMMLEQPFGQAGIRGGGGFGGRGPQQQMERELRQQKNYQTILEQRMRRHIELPQQLPPLIVREYAHRHEETKDNVRRDFTETLCWQPALVMPNGEIDVGFDLSDAVTRYQVTVLSHSLDGRLGADRFEIAARLPFSIDPKVPFEVSNTDKLVVPIAVKNDTKDDGQIELTARATGLKTQDPQARDTLQARDVMVGPGERGRGLFTYEPAIVAGQATLKVKGTFRLNQLSDTVEREFKIVPDGFPMRGAQSGLLEKAAVHEITLPNNWLPGTLTCQVQVFPSTLAELQKGLEGLLREPCGCFEQSSSSNYPNVLILNYLREAGQGDPNIEQRARGLIQNGYQRLTSFECVDPTKAATKRGYEWFGQTAPPHEALTAYGLLQFHDMANVYAVDKDMVERTTKYLLAQRDGLGGFKRNSRALDSFGRAPEHITNAYIVWALTDAGVTEDLTKELAALAAKAKDSKDPYFTALVVLGHLNRGKSDEALTFAKNLKDAQKDDGHLEGGQTSITGSQGRDLHLETTALAILAWLKANRPEEFHTSVDKAVKWISAQRSGQGSFGATQSTILALKALIAHTRDAKKIAEDGKLTLTLPERNNQVAAEASYTAGASEPITLTLAEGKGLQPGKNKVVIETTGKNTFPYTLSWSYQTLTPPSDAGCPVKLSAKLSKENAQEGDTVKLKATVENTLDKGHGMTVAILGLPAGLAIPEDAKQLKELAKLRDQGTKPGVISHWELKGRELVLYWRDLAPKAKIDVEIDLICRLPGTYRGPASRAYLYYNADAKNWIEPLQVTIDPQRGD